MEGEKDQIKRELESASEQTEMRTVPFWPLDPGLVKHQDPDPGSGMNIPDHISESLDAIG